MSKWFKRVMKERSQDLLPGETLRAATYFQSAGSASARIAGGMAHARGGSLAQERAGEAIQSAMQNASGRHHAPEGSHAALLPSPFGIFAVTDQRALVFGYKQGFFSTKILEPVAIYSFDQLTGMSYKPGSLVGTLNLAFSDSSTGGLEIPRVNKPAAFVETLGIPTV
ncbi:MAG: hypothetical protein EA398_14655, partial [Deltaproteobacteria bacterium]